MASERSAAAVGEEVRRAEGFDPAASTGLFVGVSTFEYGSIPEVPYAVDDAVDLAHKFAFDLGLLLPERSVLALAGEPKKPDSRDRLARLVERGARQIPARLADLYRQLGVQALASRPEGLFVVTVASHGLSDQGGDFLLAADSLAERLVKTGLTVSELFDEVARSRAPRRLVLLDACRERWSEDTRGLRPQPMTASFAEAIGSAEGQVVLSAATLGGYTYDDTKRGNGVFTAAVLDGLAGSARLDERGFITARTLADFVQEQVAEWVRQNRPRDAVGVLGIGRRIEGPGESLPLAVDPERERRLNRYREKRAAALEQLARQLPSARLLEGVLFNQVKQLLPLEGPGETSELLLAEIEALESGGERAQRSLRDLVRELRGEAEAEAVRQEPEEKKAVPPQPGQQDGPKAPKPTAKRLGREKEKGGGEVARQGVASAAGAPSTAGMSQGARAPARQPGAIPTNRQRWRRWAIGAAAVASALVLSWGLSRIASDPREDDPRNPKPKPADPDAGTPLDGPLGMRFRFVPAGTYAIGSPEGEPGRSTEKDRETRHLVRLTRGFWIGETEVTQAQWGELVAKNPSTFKACGGDCPVENVNWFEAAEFANRVSNRAGLALCYRLTDCTGTVGGGDFKCADASFAGLDCPGYRLPTEAEWEVAARAGTESAIYTGVLTLRGARDGPELHPIAWYPGNSGVTYPGGYDCKDWLEPQFAAERCGTHPVREKAKNLWELHDMLGNVWEWTGDRGIEPYSTELAVDPTGPGVGSMRVIRGGSWVGVARDVRAAERNAFEPGYRDDAFGFRLARGQGRSGQ